MGDPLSSDLFATLSLISVPRMDSSSAAWSGCDGSSPWCRTWNSHRAIFEYPDIDHIRDRADQDRSDNEAHTRIRRTKRWRNHVPSNVKIRWGLISFTSRLAFKFHCHSSASRSEVNREVSLRFFASFFPERSLNPSRSDRRQRSTCRQAYGEMNS